MKYPGNPLLFTQQQGQSVDSSASAKALRGALGIACHLREETASDLLCCWSQQLSFTQIKQGLACVLKTHNSVFLCFGFKAWLHQQLHVLLLCMKGNDLPKWPIVNYLHYGTESNQSFLCHWTDRSRWISWQPVAFHTTTRPRPWQFWLSWGFGRRPWHWLSLVCFAREMASLCCWCNQSS